MFAGQARLLVALSICALIAAAVSAGAGSSPPTGPAPLQYGTKDDYPKIHFECSDSNPWYAAAKELGYRIAGFAVLWDDATPTTIVDKAFLDKAVPCALSRGFRVILSVYSKRPAAIGANAAAQAAFAAYAALVARAYPGVTDIVIGNEPNQNRFWQPQQGAAAAYEATLAQAYDAIKAARSNVTVLGFAISSRGNDSPDAPSNPSASPVRFIHDAAAAYRASGRTKPIMDEFAFHPYALDNSHPYTRPIQWPNAGASELKRVKQALYDGFHGTDQPIPAEQPGGRTTSSFGGAGLPICLCEVGTQTDVKGHEPAYTGRESVTVVDPPTQGAYYQDLLELAACDPSVEAILLYQLIDETDLDRFQSGLLWADLVRKAGFAAVKAKIAAARGVCQGAVDNWVHTDAVVGAQASFDLKDRGGKSTSWSFRVRANEDASYTATLLDATGKQIMVATGTIKAYFDPVIVFRARTLPPGRYRYAVTLTAAMNPARTSVFQSGLFTVLGTGSLPPPGKEGVEPVSGIVLVNVNGKFVPLTKGQQIPTGAEIDASRGRVALTSPDGSKGTFYQGRFKVLHKSERRITYTVLALSGGNFKVCTARKPSALGKKKPPPKTVRHVWGNAKGHFRTNGRYAAATVRGTLWETRDRCDGTLVVVRRGTVQVTDQVKHKNVFVHAGRSYLAKPRR